MSQTNQPGGIRRPNLYKRIRRQLNGLVTSRQYASSKELPGAKIMTDRMRGCYAWCQPLNQPDWRGEGDYRHMRPDDPVLGVYRNGKAWALPWWIMKNHHVANVVLDDQPILITLCEICSSASAFCSDPDGRRFSFRLAGIYNGTHLITDLETGSLWNPFKGEAMTGPKQGAVLERIALSQCEWQEWLAMHPGSLVVWDQQKQREGHGSRHSPGSPGMGAGMRETLLRPFDERLAHNTLVLGVEGKDDGLAFPLQTLDRVGPVLHASVDGDDIVIFHLPGSVYALAFSPVLDGDKLTFAQDAQGLITDQSTGSQWNHAGQCSAGEKQGSTLNYVSSGVEEWYIWAAYHPATSIFSLD